MAKLTPEEEKDGEAQCHLARCGLRDEFKELGEVRQLIEEIPKSCKTIISKEMALERFTLVFDQYQEQPQLLDPHLGSVIEKLIAYIKDPTSSNDVVHMAFKFLYLITKTRGYKYVVRLLPHEVSDLEPVLNLLDKQDAKNHDTWETRYMLLLWLSIVCMIPFDMVRLDSHVKDGDGEAKKPTMDRILDAGKAYILVSDKSIDAAAYMLSRFLTRKDVKKEKLAEIVDWCLQVLNSADTETMDGMTSIAGVYRTLALLFKFGKREDLIDYAGTILQHVLKLELIKSNNILLRKLNAKLIQRLGLVFLKVRVAAWRYQRGSRSLQENLTLTGPKSEKAVATETETEEDYDIPEEVEEIIDQLLLALRDPTTSVRWSAAKGIGRVTGRLPKELADDVVGSLLELFSVGESDAAWHGGCLTLAELGRRGLLLPQRLPDVVPVIIKALSFDEKKGNFSTGSHVRDAACYVCWAFARAYEPDDIKLYVQQLACALIIACVFDREVSVRRAAAAAYQENVGRQGQFPHGIDILTTCDYFTVGNRTKCFHEICVYVAQFEEYAQPLVDHLANVVIGHWDNNMRVLISQALHYLTPRVPEYMANKILPQLLGNVTSPDLNVRHCSILCVAEITHALSKMAQSENKSVTEIIGNETSEKLKRIVYDLDEQKLYRGVGGELMRKATCFLIKKLALSKMEHAKDPVIERWLQLIDECLEYKEEEIQQLAVDAIPAFFSECYLSDGDAESRERILAKYLQSTMHGIQEVRCGYTLALGALPAMFIRGKLTRVLQTLYKAIEIDLKTLKWAAARRDAVKALKNICSSVGVKPDGSPEDVLCAANIPGLYGILFAALEDYTQDSRGDVGAWVREEGMACLETVTTLLVDADSSLLDKQIVSKMFCCLVQQACEKIDRTRACAGQAFSSLLYYRTEVPHIPHREEVLNVFTKKRVNEINWAAPAETFHEFIKLLPLETYSYRLLLGLVVSVGGLTESLVKYSSMALMHYLGETGKTPGSIQKFADQLIAVYRDNLKNDRVTVPMFKTLDRLLSNGHFSLFIEDSSSTVPTELLNLSKKEISRCNDPQKIKASIDVYCGLLQFPSIRQSCLAQLMVFLGHKYPIVRKSTANTMYEALVTYDDVVDPEKMDEVMSILSETLWDKSAAEVKPVRNQLCEVLGIPVPKPKTPGAKAS